MTIATSLEQTDRLVIGFPMVVLLAAMHVMGQHGDQFHILNVLMVKIKILVMLSPSLVRTSNLDPRPQFVESKP